jgi:radical SAM protein with 4Fe4S-binding SPASM domain
MSGSDCIVRDEGSSEFFETLSRAPARRNELPVTGSFDLTRRCNLACRHCYVHDPGARAEELSTSNVLRVLDKLADAGVLSLLLTGGEIFLRPDFREIYLHTRQRGFIVTLFTNATLVMPELADFLAERAPRRIEVTAYGHTRGTYENVTGVKGSFDRFRHGVGLLLDHGLHVELKALVTKTNAHELEDMERWAGELGCAFRYDPMISPRLDANPVPLAERLSPEDAARLLGTGDESLKLFARNRRSARETASDGRLLRCGAGVQTFHIDADGRIHPCMIWRPDGYSLMDGSVEEWNARIAGLRTAPLPADSLCGNCVNRYACGNCAATSLLEAGATGLHVNFFCRVCEEREKLLGIKTYELNNG